MPAGLGGGGGVNEEGNDIVGTCPEATELNRQKKVPKKKNFIR